MADAAGEQGAAVEWAEVGVVLEQLRGGLYIAGQGRNRAGVAADVWPAPQTHVLTYELGEGDGEVQQSYNDAQGRAELGVKRRSRRPLG